MRDGFPFKPANARIKQPCFTSFPSFDRHPCPFPDPLHKRASRFFFKQDSSAWAKETSTTFNQRLARRRCPVKSSAHSHLPGGNASCGLEIISRQASPNAFCKANPRQTCYLFSFLTDPVVLMVPTRQKAAATSSRNSALIVGQRQICVHRNAAATSVALGFLYGAFPQHKESR